MISMSKHAASNLLKILLINNWEWHYFATIKTVLQLSWLSLRLPPFETTCFFFFTIDVSTLSSTPGLGMTDRKSLWQSISFTEVRPCSITNFKPFAPAVKNHKKCQQQCNSRWHARSLSLALAQLPSWRVGSHPENCIFHVTHTLTGSNMYANSGTWVTFSQGLGGKEKRLVIEDYVQYIMCVYWEVMCGFCESIYST